MPSRNRCPSCGKRHVPGFAYCQRCGAPLNEAPSVTNRVPEAETEPALNDDPETDFQAVQPQPPQPRSRAGCTGMLATLLIVAVAWGCGTKLFWLLTHAK